MHLISLFLQVRSKHGLHGRSGVITTLLSPSSSGGGPVRIGSVEPNMATIGVLTAYAICSGPESFVRKTSHSEISEISSLRDVFPAKLTSECDVRNSGIAFLYISSAISTSDFPPKIIALPPVSLINQFAISANLSGNHLLAEPYVAPGLIPKMGLFIFFNSSLACNLSSKVIYIYGNEY